MKKIYLVILLIAVAFSTVFSQVPNAFNYQAVVRNSSGEILANKTVSFRISLLKNSETGTVVYSETHSLSTNEFGLVNFKIGKGARVSGAFSPSDWGEVIFTKVEFDPAGGSSFSELATTKLSSVPFAFVAQTVVNDKVDDADADPANEIQTLSLNGTLLELSNGGGSVTLPASGGSGGDNWGAQTVKTNSTLTGDGTSAHPLSVVADGDGDDSNELQSLSISGNNLTLSDGGSTVALPASPWNETASKVQYIGNKVVSIKEGSGSGLKTKSGSKANPPKFEVEAQERTAISIYNETSLYPGLDIWNEEGIAARFNNNSNKPVAVFENYDVGLAAQFKSKIQIADGTQGAGKVLTSDADGVASWQAPAAGGGSSLWTESGSDVYRASGNVGIGTSNPSYNLDIYNSSGDVGLQLNSAQSTYIVLNRGVGEYAGINFKTDGDYKFRVGLLSDSYFSIHTAAAHRGLTIDNSGNVSLTNNLNVDGDLFVNQNLEVADDLTVGSVTISGSEVQTTNTGNTNMLPIAYGSVRSDGTLISGASSGNVSVSHPSVGYYAITITGVTYDYLKCAQSVTLLGDIGFVRTGSSSGKLLVYTYDITGRDVDDKKNIMFSFVVYKP